jgi:hypothetical protein
MADSIVTPELEAQLGAMLESARRSHDSTRRLRRALYDPARDALALKGDPAVVASELVDQIIAKACPGLDRPGSFDERQADLLVGAITDAVEGRPLGPCPEIYRAEDFVPPGQDPRYRFLAETMARMSNEAAREPGEGPP